MARLGVSDRTLRTWVTQRRLGSLLQRPPGGGPEEAVYHAADVDRIVLERRRRAGTVVLPAVQDSPAAAGGPDARDLVRGPTADGALTPVLEVLCRRVATLVAEAGSGSGTSGASSGTSEVPGPWMTVAAIARRWRRPWTRKAVQARVDAGELGETFVLGTGPRPRVLVRASAVVAFEEGRGPRRPRELDEPLFEVSQR